MVYGVGATALGLRCLGGGCVGERVDASTAVAVFAAVRVYSGRGVAGLAECRVVVTVFMVGSGRVTGILGVWVVWCRGSSSVAVGRWYGGTVVRCCGKTVGR